MIIVEQHQLRRAMVYFDVTDVAWVNVVISNINCISFQWFSIGHFSQFTVNENI